MDKGIITKERKSTLKETKRNEWSIHYDTNSSYKRSIYPLGQLKTSVWWHLDATFRHFETKCQKVISALLIHSQALLNKVVQLSCKEVLIKEKNSLSYIGLDTALVVDKCISLRIIWELAWEIEFQIRNKLVSSKYLDNLGVNTCS